MFSSCSSLSSLPDISKWNIDKVTDMDNMFYACLSLTSLPNLSKWNTKNAKDMNLGSFSLLNETDSKSESPNKKK